VFLGLSPFPHCCLLDFFLFYRGFFPLVPPFFFDKGVYYADLLFVEGFFSPSGPIRGALTLVWAYPFSVKFFGAVLFFQAFFPRLGSMGPRPALMFCKPAIFLFPP